MRTPILSLLIVSLAGPHCASADVWSYAEQAAAAMSDAVAEKAAAALEVAKAAADHLPSVVETGAVAMQAAKAVGGAAAEKGAVAMEAAKAVSGAAAEKGAAALEVAKAAADHLPSVVETGAVAMQAAKAVGGAAAERGAVAVEAAKAVGGTAAETGAAAISAAGAKAGQVWDNAYSMTDMYENVEYIYNRSGDVYKTVKDAQAQMANASYAAISISEAMLVGAYQLSSGLAWSIVGGNLSTHVPCVPEAQVSEELFSYSPTADCFLHHAAILLSLLVKWAAFIGTSYILLMWPSETVLSLAAIVGFVYVFHSLGCSWILMFVFRAFERSPVCTIGAVLATRLYMKLSSRGPKLACVVLLNGCLLGISIRVLPLMFTATFFLGLLTFAIYDYSGYISTQMKVALKAKPPLATNSNAASPRDSHFFRRLSMRPPLAKHISHIMEWVDPSDTTSSSAAEAAPDVSIEKKLDTVIDQMSVLVAAIKEQQATIGQLQVAVGHITRVSQGNHIIRRLYVTRV